MRIRVIDSLTEVHADAWNAAACDAARAQDSDTDNPFTRHEFLLALEQSGAASPRANHLALPAHVGNDGKV